MVKFRDTEGRVVVTRELEEGRNGELLFNEIRISVWVDEKALKMDSGDDCPAIGMHLMPLNCTF